MPTLQNWFVSVLEDGLYKALEQMRVVLCGEIFGHPMFKDGEKVTTSKVIKVSRVNVVTLSGNEYVLGEVAPGYKKYLEGLGRKFDLKQPFGFDME